MKRDVIMFQPLVPATSTKSTGFFAAYDRENDEFLFQEDKPGALLVWRESRLCGIDTSQLISMKKIMEKELGGFPGEFDRDGGDAA